MKRHVMGLAYHGKHYHGWQIQPEDISVQAKVQHALKQFSLNDVSIVCAGRTDSGVHAAQQCIHFDSDVERPSHSWVKGTNAFLPNDIQILWHKIIDDDFHARFSAISRRYCYLLRHQEQHQVLWQDNALVLSAELNIDNMREASKYLLGEHDFSSFRVSQCQAHSPVRTIHVCDVIQKDQWVGVRIEANAFLHHMVRIIVYTLIQVGLGIEQPIWIKDLLLAKSRLAINNMSPACGLYFEGAKYKDDYHLPNFYTTLALEGV
jgi:tRNA pseudouridine38-40 synthase